MKNTFLIAVIIMIAVAFTLTGVSLISSHASEEPMWEITQYSCDSGNVALFYSLRNTVDGTFILVDSGNPENAGKVSRVIDENGGHVDAWFLTHYHNDHIGAFNEIYEKYEDQIDQIYVTPMDYALYVDTAHEWDHPEVYTRFLELT